MMASSLLWVSVLLSQTTTTITVKPRVSTSPVITDADDAAIWRHPTDPSKSLIIGTDKGTYPNGGLYVWNLDGTQKQKITVSNPNNIDVRYGLKLAGQTVDIAVASMRDHRQVRVYKIDPSARKLTEITTLDTTNVLNKMFRSPYGLTLYKRPSDELIFAIVSSRHNDYKSKLWQIQLEDDGTGHVKGTLARTFGNFQNIVEGMVADDELGFLYASEEKVGIHKYNADPKKSNTPLAFFATEDSLNGNNEGLALYKCANGTGYLLIAHPETHSLKVYHRQGEPGAPHKHVLLARVQDDSLKAGDGLEVSSGAYAPIFPRGFVAWHNQAGRNFRLYAWEDIAKNFLTICDGAPNAVAAGSTSAVDNAAFVILQQNAPNPFSASGNFGNPETEIRFVLKKAGRVELTIYNILGEAVRHLLSSALTPGNYNLRWDAKDDKGVAVSSGIYFYQLRADKFLETRRMVLSR
jgi:3-phytase